VERGIDLTAVAHTPSENPSRRRRRSDGKKRCPAAVGPVRVIAPERIREKPSVTAERTTVYLPSEIEDIHANNRPALARQADPGAATRALVETVRVKESIMK
jgi:hypothetical protein